MHAKFGPFKVNFIKLNKMQCNNFVSIFTPRKGPESITDRIQCDIDCHPWNTLCSQVKRPDPI